MAGVVAEWREVAFLHGIRGSDRMGSRARSRTFRYGLGTSGAPTSARAHAGRVAIAEGADPVLTLALVVWPSDELAARIEAAPAAIATRITV